MDILLDEDFDISFEDGDLKVGDDTEQRVMLLLDSDAGHWKQWPTVGVGILGMFNGQRTQDVRRSIQLQLASDGLKLSTVSFDNGELDIKLQP